MGHGLLTRKGSWQTRELADWARTMLRAGHPLANAEDMAIPRCVGSVDETLAIIRENRDEWLQQQAARGQTHEGFPRAIWTSPGVPSQTSRTGWSARERMRR